MHPLWGAVYRCDSEPRQLLGHLLPFPGAVRKEHQEKAEDEARGEERQPRGDEAEVALQRRAVLRGDGAECVAHKLAVLEVEHGGRVVVQRVARIRRRDKLAVDLRGHGTRAGAHVRVGSIARVVLPYL